MYNLDTSFIKQKYNIAWIFLIIAIMATIAISIIAIIHIVDVSQDGMTNEEFLQILIMISGFTLPISLFIISYVIVKKVDERLNIVNNLNKSGTLIKNLPCTIKILPIRAFGYHYYQIIVEYPDKEGKIWRLKSDMRLPYQSPYHHKTADLLIDLENTNKFFIDFEIK